MVTIFYLCGKKLTKSFVSIFLVIGFTWCPFVFSIRIGLLNMHKSFVLYCGDQLKNYFVLWVDYLYDVDYIVMNITKNSHFKKLFLFANILRNIYIYHTSYRKAYKCCLTINGSYHSFWYWNCQSPSLVTVKLKISM